MSVVSIAEAWPSPGKPFTVAEPDRMPDDGHRYELLDGVLVVSRRPAWSPGCSRHPPDRRTLARPFRAGAGPG